MAISTVGQEGRRKWGHMTNHVTDSLKVTANFTALVESKPLEDEPQLRRQRSFHVALYVCLPPSVSTNLYKTRKNKVNIISRATSHAHMATWGVWLLLRQLRFMASSLGPNCPFNYHNNTNFKSIGDFSKHMITFWISYDFGFFSSFSLVACGWV